MKKPWVVVLLLVSCACDGRDLPESGGIPDRDISAELSILHQIGGTNARVPEEEFGYVGAVSLSPAGDIYVLDSMAGTVRRFGEDGILQNSIGQRGQGPGEFQNPFALDFREEELGVWDASLWRITTFASNGEARRSEPVERRAESGWVPSIARASDGSWLYLDQEIESPNDPGAALTNGIIRGTANLHRWASPESGWQQVGAFQGMEAALVTRDGVLGLANAPFPAGPLWTPAPEASYWYADSHSYEIVRISFEGDTLARIEGNREGAAVSDSAWNAFVGGASGDLPTSAARGRADLRRPQALPVLFQLLSSTEGDLWVELNLAGADATEWHVYTADGEPKYRVHLPMNARLAGISGDRVAAIVRDELDVQSVVVYALP